MCVCSSSCSFPTYVSVRERERATESEREWEQKWAVEEWARESERERERARESEKEREGEARPSWVKLKRHEWKRLWGFTVRVLFNKTNKQTRGRGRGRARARGRGSTGLNLWQSIGVLKPVSPGNRAELDKSGHFQFSGFEFLYRPFWGFWLFSGSRSCLIGEKRSRKDSWYQDYSFDTTAAFWTSHRHTAALLPETARKIWKQIISISVKELLSNYRSPSGFAILMKNHPFAFWKGKFEDVRFLPDSQAKPLLSVLLYIFTVNCYGSNSCPSLLACSYTRLFGAC